MSRVYENNSKQSNRMNKDSDNSPVNGSMDDSVCRDFLRRVCNRGNRCKYVHSEETSLGQKTYSDSKQKKETLTFCHDYHNGHCKRSTCRFIHASVDEENNFLKFGQLLNHIFEQSIYKGCIIDTEVEDTPVCRDYVMGECNMKRGGSCRFRHLTESEYREEIYDMYPEAKPAYTSATANQPKRMKMDPLPFPLPPIEGEIEYASRYPPRDLLHPLPLYDYREREYDRELDRRAREEQLRKQVETFKKEVSSLKKENSDLRATNDFLLEKITTMGIAKAGGTVTTVTVPTVSLASTIPVATSVQPLTAAQVSHPLTINSEGCSVVAMAQAQAAPQSMAQQTQIVAQPPAGVLGSVGGVQVSLSQAMAPQTSISGSLAPAISAPNIAQAMSMSAAASGLVSYPIMTQPAGLRQSIQ